MDGRQPESGHYAMSAINECRQAVPHLSEGMANWRSGVERHLATDREKASDCYEGLKHARHRLVETVKDCRRFLLELGEDGLAAHAGALASGLAGFNLMTRDYGPLLGALSGFAGKLPAADTVSAATIAHCMNQVSVNEFTLTRLNQ
jgi:hypothetical protein